MLQTKPQIRPLLLIVLGLAYALGMVLLGFFWTREASLPLLLTFALTFGSSLLLYRHAEDKNHLNALLFLGLLVRFSYLFTWPELSDDFYRFFFDGLLVQQGINPYSHLPEEAIALLPSTQRHAALQLLQEMNSPQYHSVYPPLQQALFALGAWIGPQLHTQLLFHKVLLLLAEVLSIRLLLYLLAQPRQALLYALNPLVILEGVGNLHAEIYIVSCLLVLLLAFAKGHWQASILVCWTAIGLKLLPLIYLPLLLKKKKWPLQVLASGFLALGLSIPFWLPGAWEGFRSSLSLYQSNFEFFPFLYGYLRDIGQLLLGYNPIQTLGKLLNGAVLIALMLLYLQAWKRGIPGIQTLSAYFYMALSVYLIAQTTLHPWYLLPLLPLALLSGMRAAIPWTAIAFLSYVHYGSYPDWVEDLCRWIGYGSLVPFLWADAQKLRLRYFTPEP